MNLRRVAKAEFDEYLGPNVHSGRVLRTETTQPNPDEPVFVRTFFDAPGHVAGQQVSRLAGKEYYLPTPPPAAS